jgi:hypothetical protein
MKHRKRIREATTMPEISVLESSFELLKDCASWGFDGGRGAELGFCGEDVDVMVGNREVVVFGRRSVD